MLLKLPIVSLETDLPLPSALMTMSLMAVYDSFSSTHEIMCSVFGAID